MATNRNQNSAEFIKRQAKWGILLFGCAICTASSPVGFSGNSFHPIDTDAASANGAILFEGQAAFYLDNGMESKRIGVKATALSIDQSGLISINYQGSLYRLEAHKDIACPLGQFVSRDGGVAYAVLPDSSEISWDSMKALGL
jgi:hypothetical protein